MKGCPTCSSQQPTSQSTGHRARGVEDPWANSGVQLTWRVTSTSFSSEHTHVTVRRGMRTLVARRYSYAPSTTPSTLVQMTCDRSSRSRGTLRRAPRDNISQTTARPLRLRGSSCHFRPPSLRPPHEATSPNVEGTFYQCPSRFQEPRTMT